MGKNKNKKKVEALKVLHTDTYYVLDKTTHEHEIEYVINVHDTEKGTLVEMFVADNGIWNKTLSISPIVSVIDTGDGFEWKTSPDVTDYSNAYVMMILFNFLDTLNTVRSRYEICLLSPILGVNQQ